MMVALTGMNVSCTGMILQSYNSVHLIFYNSQKKEPEKCWFYSDKEVFNQHITNAGRQVCKQKQRVNHFQKWSPLCFSISALLRSRTPFLREKV